MDLPENKIICGDCLEVMKDWPDNSVDAIVTDIPYGIGFMGKEWDTFKPEVVTQEMKRDTRTQKRRQLYGGRESDAPSAAMAAGRYDFNRNAEYQEWCRIWSAEALRIAKPGAFLLCFGGTRTYHRVTCGLEDAGWQIRDCMMWLYGSGFPKSLDISKAIDKAKGAERKRGITKKEDIFGKYNEPAVGKYHNPKTRQNWCSSGVKTDLITESATNLAKQWQGYGTALKPAWEPIIVAMKPLAGTFAANAEQWGVAGLNIDGGRISLDGEKQPSGSAKRVYKNNQFTTEKIYGENKTTPPQGRWPANLILDEEAAAMLDEQSGELQSGAMTKPYKYTNTGHSFGKPTGETKQMHVSNSGGASRFFYCAKASRAERNAGLEGMEKKHAPKGNNEGRDMDNEKNHLGGMQGSYMQNHHPTVKPLKLMQYLCRLLKPPQGGILLDPFCGSGTTLMAAVSEGWDYIGIDREAEYVEIAEKRVAWIKKQNIGQLALFEKI